MAKEDWGNKRLCQSCATKFYDFGRSPIVCPKCSATFDPEILLKSRRSRSSASKSAKAPKAAVDPKPKKTTDVELDEAIKAADGVDVTDRAESDDDDDSVLQDTSDLGGDDVKEVISSSEKDASSDDR